MRPGPSSRTRRPRCRGDDCPSAAAAPHEHARSSDNRRMSSEPIDLRSDTVTRPTPAMRAAMAAAPVGDDQYGEDPLTNALQERVAALLGKEAALWLPSGTMANQVALRVLTRPGDEVVVSREGARRLARDRRRRPPTPACSSSRSAPAASSPSTSSRRRSSRAACRSIRRRRWSRSRTPTTAAAASSSPQDEVVRICALARSRGIATFLDGARLWNAASRAASPRPSSRRRSTWSRSRSRRASARPAARCSPARAS